MRFMSWILTLAGTIAPIVAARANDNDVINRSDYFVDESTLPFDALPGFPSTRYWGVLQRAGYRIEVPANWNGELVMFAHGTRSNGLPDNKLSIDPGAPFMMRPYLVRNGYAWAMSTYSKNLYDVKAGVLDTHHLRQLVESTIGKPTRAYMYGASMGAQIGAVTIEQWPQDYDGAFLVCGPLASPGVFDFLLSYNLAAQAIAGIDAQFPEPDDYQSVVVPQIKAALGAPFPNNLNAAGRELRDVAQQLSGGTRPFFDVAFRNWATFILAGGYGDGTRLVAAQNQFTNIDVVYQSDDDPALSMSEQELNDTILRVQAQHRPENGLANIPPINGTLSIPVMTMHGVGDRVPISMEQIYARRVAANGASHLLTQRAIRDVVHCGFVPSELEQGFTDMAKWVATGVKAAGDDLLDPAKVANENFGCTFTKSRRAALPACSTP